MPERIVVAKDKPLLTPVLSLHPSVETVCAAKGERAGASVYRKDQHGLLPRVTPTTVGLIGSSQRPFLSAGAGERPDPRLVGGKFLGRP